MTIKHLVLSGGGPVLFSAIGVIQQLEENKKICLDDIQSIYGTSAGGILGVMLCLHFDWTTLNDYLIQRPWHEAFPVNAGTIFDAYTKRGIYDKSFLDIMFKPLFSAKDIPMNITMEQFYEYSKIDLHLYTFELHEFVTIDISYKTHPTLELLTVLHMSSAFPILFSPCCVDNKCYLDGGIRSNYPLKFCIDSGAVIDEILGIKNDYLDMCEKNMVTESSTILDYMMNILNKLTHNFSTEHSQETIPNEVVCPVNRITVQYLKHAMTSQEKRIELFEIGKNAAMQFIENSK